MISLYPSPHPFSSDSPWQNPLYLRSQQEISPWKSLMLSLATSTRFERQTWLNHPFKLLYWRQYQAWWNVFLISRESGIHQVKGEEWERGRGERSFFFLWSSYPIYISSPLVPLAYTIHLKQSLIIYLSTLPFQIVPTAYWATPIIVCIASFTLLGIEAVSCQIENPFGFDENDLPLEDYCDQ